MSITKKRHIIKSNLILEERYLISETMTSPETETIELCLKIAGNQDPTLKSKYDQLLSELKKTTKNFPRKEIRELVGSAFTKTNEWCKTDPKEFPSSIDKENSYIQTFCREVLDYIAGDNSTYLKGFMDMFPVV